MKFLLSLKSKSRLKGVHPDLVKVVNLAITKTEVDFVVLEGLRTVEKQAEYVRKGASRTMKSRHIHGFAVDLGALIDGKVNWSWPLYSKIAKAMKDSAKELNVPIVWGGDWKTFKDGPHFELLSSKYPDPK